MSSVVPTQPAASAAAAAAAAGVMLSSFTEIPACARPLDAVPHDCSAVTSLVTAVQTTSTSCCPLTGHSVARASFDVLNNSSNGNVDVTSGRKRTTRRVTGVARQQTPSAAAGTLLKPRMACWSGVAQAAPPPRPRRHVSPAVRPPLQPPTALPSATRWPPPTFVPPVPYLNRPDMSRLAAVSAGSNIYASTVRSVSAGFPGIPLSIQIDIIIQLLVILLILLSCVSMQYMESTMLFWKFRPSLRLSV